MSDKTLDFRYIVPPENSRTYIFPGGGEVRIEKVSAVCVRPGGSHRLETADGMKYIIPPGWLAIRLVVDAWTF